MGEFASTPQGNPALARIQGCACTTEAIGAYFQDNDALIEWVNHQPLASPITCLGMGMTEFGTSSKIAPNGERREILDWYHLMENLHKVGGSLKRLRQAETLLCRAS